MPHLDDDYSLFTGFDPGFGTSKNRDFSFSFDDVAGGTRKKRNLFSDLDLEKAVEKQEKETKNLEVQQLKKQKRKAGLQGILTMLPTMVQTLTARDERSLQNSLENAANILERRMAALTEQKERERQRQHEIGIRESEREEKRSEAKLERGHEKELQTTSIAAQEKLESIRGAREENILGRTQEFTLSLEKTRNQFDLEKLELDQKHTKELQRRGLAHDTDLLRFNISNQWKEKLNADGLSLESSDEVSNILANGGSFKDLRPETQAALTAIDGMKSARNLSELNLIRAQSLAGVHGIRVPIIDPITGEVLRDFVSKDERSRPLTSAELLSEFDPDYAFNLVKGLGAKLPPEEISADGDKSVAQVQSERDELVGQHLASAQTVASAVERVKVSSNPNEAASDFGAASFKTTGYNDRIAISLVNSSTLPEDLKEIARKTIFELKKRLEEEKQQEDLNRVKDPGGSLNFGQYPQR